MKPIGQEHMVEVKTECTAIDQQYRDTIRTYNGNTLLYERGHTINQPQWLALMDSRYIFTPTHTIKISSARRAFLWFQPINMSCKKMIIAESWQVGTIVASNQPLVS